ncbi:MAG: GerAB/ArcD/ProY family transporter [Clostridia bacterium]|nr:GerAB/ArcD/ProY family transporter [Clostridia bacterium]
METSTKFSNTEIVFVISNLVISKLFLVYPSAFAALGASASLLLAVATSVVGFVFMILFGRLLKTKPDISAILKSKGLSMIFSILLISLFICNQGYFVRSVSESLKISILPKSPLIFITFIYIAGVLICAHTGLKAIVRAHSFVTPFTIVLVIFLVISSVGNFDFYNLFPVMGNGYVMFLYLPLLLAYFADFIILLFILPFASEKSNVKKIVYPSYIISSVVLIAVIGVYTLVIPNSASDKFFIPVYRVAQYINFQSFMARMESVFTIGWMLSYFLTSSTYLYITSMLTGRLFKAKSYRPFMYVIAAVVSVISFVPDDINALVKYSNYFSIPRLILCMIIPVAILSLSKYREKKRK